MREFFGTLLRKRRTELCITLRELAVKAGCMPSFLSEVENNLRRAPKDEVLLEKLARILKLDKNRVLKAAKNDQERRDMRDLKAMFAQDDELAACYCRAKETCDEEELRQVLKDAFQKLLDERKI